MVGQSDGFRLDQRKSEFMFNNGGMQRKSDGFRQENYIYQKKKRKWDSLQVSRKVTVIIAIFHVKST